MAAPMARFTEEDSSIGKFRLFEIKILPKFPSLLGQEIERWHNFINDWSVRRETWMKRGTFGFTGEIITRSFIERALIAFSQLAVRINTMPGPRLCIVTAVKIMLTKCLGNATWISNYETKVILNDRVDAVSATRTFFRRITLVYHSIWD